MLHKHALILLVVFVPVVMADELNGFYARDYEGFWKQWEQSRATAVSCAFVHGTSQFLSNALETTGNAEVTEANARVIENLTISNAECMLRGLGYLRPEERTSVVSLFLCNPLFRSLSEIEGALKQIWVEGHHLELRKVYEEINRDCQLGAGSDRPLAAVQLDS